MKPKLNFWNNKMSLEVKSEISVKNKNEEILWN